MSSAGRVVRVRTARPGEYAAIGELTARVYRTAGFLPAGHPYLATLRDAAGRAAAGELLVAEDDAGRLVGSAALIPPGAGRYGDPAAGPRDATLRALVVAPTGQRAGVGATLVGACIDRARTLGAPVLWLSTLPGMDAAQRLYLRLGFVRRPEHDWTAPSGSPLITYALPLG